MLNDLYYDQKLKIFKENCKVGITGASGYIGQHLISKFIKTGVDLIAFSRHQVLNYKRYRNFKFVKINNYLDFPNIKCDFLVHLAEDPFSNSKRLNDENKLVIDEIVKKTSARIFYFSSGLVYKKKTLMPFDEDDDLNPVSIYQKNKIFNEKKILQFGGTILRPSTFLGKYPAPNTLLDDMITLIKNNSPLIVKNSNTVRDFIFFEDAFNFLLRLLIFNCKGVFNLSYGKGISVSEIGLLLQRKIGHEVEKKIKSHSKSKVTDYLVLNNMKIIKYTGYVPQYSLNNIIEKFNI